MAFLISDFRLFILQLTPRCLLLYLATNIRLRLSFFLFGLFCKVIFTPTRSCLLAHLFFFILHPIISSCCLHPCLISSSHFSSSHFLTAQASCRLSSYHGCLIAFIDQQYCFLLSFPFCFRPIRYISSNPSFLLHNFNLNLLNKFLLCRGKTGIFSLRVNLCCG